MKKNGERGLPVRIGEQDARAPISKEREFKEGCKRTLYLSSSDFEIAFSVCCSKFDYHDSDVIIGNAWSGRAN
jgi:hypothetical protein